MWAPPPASLSPRKGWKSCMEGSSASTGNSGPSGIPASASRGALSQLLDLLRSSGADSDRYGKALQMFGTKLEAPGLEQLRSLVDVIAAETKLIARKNQHLQDQLHLSGAQLDELRRNLDSVRQEAITDSLTGLFNRRKFDESIQEAATQATQAKTSLCLLMTDIDHFKKFNDNYGHTIGDHVLALVARTVKECIRSSDTAVRYGGEEFAVILPNPDKGFFRLRFRADSGAEG